MLRNFIKSIAVGILLLSVGCVSNQGDNDSQFSDLESPEAQASADQPSAEGTEPSESATSTEDAFSDFDNKEQAQSQPPPAEEAKEPSADSDLQQNEQAAEPQTPLEDELSKTQEPLPPQEQAMVIPPEPPPEVNTPAPEPVPFEPPPKPSKMVEITGLKFKANETGGTILIEASGPLAYTTRTNPELNQFIVEVPNSKLPSRLKRPLNTKDFNGGIGSIDAYQTAGSTTSRFIVQLRQGASEPFIQVEGNTLLVVSSDPTSQAITPTAANFKPNESSAQSDSAGHSETALSSDSSADSDLNINLNDSRILTSQSLVDFISGNSKFYGKKISVEFTKTPVINAIRFFIEETGINMIIDKDVTGEVTMKLRQVPWDQAFITMLRMNELIYQRQGSILRIAPILKLQKEEDDAKKLADAKKLTQPLKVRNFFMNFVTTTVAATSIKELLKENGKESTSLKIVEDPKNGKIIVQESEETLNLIEKIVKNLDMPTKQVLIEGKIVEASDKFSRGIGITWGLNGGQYTSGNLNFSPNLNVGSAGSGSDLRLGFSLGTLPVIGDLSAQLTLAELEQTVKIVSAPRLLTITGEAATMNVDSTLVSRGPTTIAASGTGPVTTETYITNKLPLSLQVTPRVTPDHFVAMKLSVSRAVGTLNQTGQAVIDERKVDTNVLVRDGQTIAIGGLYQTDTTQGEQGVPGLKDIPVIGVLFRSKTEVKQKTELLIFVTPRVVSQDTQSAAAETETPAL